jgi:putative membrane protein
MKKSKSLLFSAPLAAAALCFGVGSSYGQSSPGTSDPTSSAVRSSDTDLKTTPTTAKLKFMDKRFVTKVAEGTQLEIAMAELASNRATNPEIRNFAQQLVSDHTELSRKLATLAESKGLGADIAEYSYRESSTAMYPTGSAKTTAPVTVAVDAPRNQPGLTNYDETRTQAKGTLDDRSATSSTAPSSVASSSAIDRSRASSDTGVAGAPTGRVASTDSADWNDPTKSRHYKKLAAKTGAEFDQAFVDAMISDHEDDVAAFEKKSQNAKDSDLQAFAASNLPKLQEHLAKARSFSTTSTTKSEP